LRSPELGRHGLNADPAEAAYDLLSDDELLAAAAVPTPERIFQIEALLRRGFTVAQLFEATKVDPWFCDQILQITEERAALEECGFDAMTPRAWKRAKQFGFADAQLSYLWGVPAAEVRAARIAAGVEATFKTVDTCSAEFEAETPYHYSTYEDVGEVAPSDQAKVIILGSGPNRIGQGVEFDYCCVHAAFALSEAGYETIMVNCNPETVSTDYDTSDRLYFEPLTEEDVRNVIDAELRSSQAAGGSGIAGVVVSLGGQTPLKLASVLPEGLVVGTSPESIDLAEDRERWNALCARLDIPQPAGGTAGTVEEALAVADRIGYPVLVRPSYVLGGRAMVIVYADDDLREAMAEMAVSGSLGREGGLSAERPVLIDRFLEEATEVDVDAIRDMTGEVVIGGVMEHVEEAGVHSGDSACMLPPVHLSEATVALLERYVKDIAHALNVVGLINVQFAVKQFGTGAADQVFVLEANPRASRTVPFVAKATGVPLVKVATRVMMGASLADLRQEGLLGRRANGDHISVKEAVLPFSRFPEADAILGPEMKSTGEVMGIDLRPGLAFAKSQIAAGAPLPAHGTVLMSLADRDKADGVEMAQVFTGLGLIIAATSGTAAALSEAGVPVSEVVAKVGEGGTDVVELIDSGRVQLVVNTPRGRGSRADGDHIRRAASRNRVPLLTTASAGLAAADGMADWARHPLRVRSLQEYHRGVTSDQLALEL
ncbi:MAG: carbamoyl-phosphate synthase large subunit, partial [bacterium]|nr:carbamoyl-phosphate synthase large subunit [bacterium]